MILTCQCSSQIDAEKKAFLAKRKEESRHEYTANEAAARFKFRDGGEKQKEEKVFNEEQIRAQNNQKLFDDIFSGKGIDIENTKEKKGEKGKGEKGGGSGGRSRRASVDLGGSIGGIRRTSVDLGGSIGGVGLGVGKGVLALPPGLEKGGRSRAGSGSGENSPSNRSRRSSISGSATPSHAAMMGRASANASAEATPKRMQQKNLTAYQIAVPAGTKSRMGSRRPSVV